MEGVDKEGGGQRGAQNGLVASARLLFYAPSGVPSALGPPVDLPATFLRHRLNTGLCDAARSAQKFYYAL